MGFGYSSPCNFGYEIRNESQAQYQARLASRTGTYIRLQEIILNNFNTNILNKRGTSKSRYFLLEGIAY